jgi:hypothetical protein
MSEVSELWNEDQRQKFVHWLSTMVTTSEGVAAHHHLRRKMRHRHLAKMLSTTVEMDDLSPYEKFDRTHMPAWLQDNYMPPSCPGGC